MKRKPGAQRVGMSILPAEIAARASSEESDRDEPSSSDSEAEDEEEGDREATGEPHALLVTRQACAHLLLMISMSAKHVYDMSAVHASSQLGMLCSNRPGVPGQRRSICPAGQA